MQDLFKERVQIFKDATRFNKPKRIPNLSNFWSYKIMDAGYRLSEGVYDFDILKDSVFKFQEKYQFDSFYETNWRNPLSIAKALGRVNYIINDEQNAICFLDESNMKTEDYDDLIANPEKYIWEKFMPQKYNGINLEKVKNGLGEFGKFLQFRGETTAVLKDKYQVPSLSIDDLFAPAESLGNGMRGLTNLSIDIRRIPDKVEAAIDALDHYYNALETLKATSTVGTTQEAVFDIHVPLISHTLMGKKSFERFYLPYLKDLCDYAVKFDKTISLFAEGENSRLYEYFQELPKGHVALYLEQDNLFEAKKKLQNICLVGGSPVSLLASGNKQECIDYAKKLIDELNDGGGYIFSADKMITFKRDCNPENLKAINEFVANYQI